MTDLTRDEKTSGAAEVPRPPGRSFRAMALHRASGLRRADLLGVAGILAVVVMLTIHWAPLSFWSPDALFYEARVEQIHGASEEEALTEVWQGPLAGGFRAGDARLPPGSQALADPDWIPYHYDFFDRRLLSPVLASAIRPIAGTDSLEVVAILGVAAFALLLLILLRQRFSPAASAIAVVVCLLWPPMRWAFMPLTESWGLALVCLALLAALFVMERGGNWFWVWVIAVFALSFTRDLTPVVLAAAGCLVLLLRNRRSVELAGSGLVAALPAPLLGGTPLRDHLAFAFNNNRIPEDSSWSFVADRYLDELEEGIRGNVEYIFQAEPRFLEEALPLFPLTLPIIAGIVLLFIAKADLNSDVFLWLMRGAFLGGIAYYLLLPHFNYLRYELVFLPMVAAGIAIGIDQARNWAGRSSGPSTAPS